MSLALATVVSFWAPLLRVMEKLLSMTQAPPLSDDDELCSAF